MTPLAQDILAFWFGPAMQSAEAAQARSKVWFSYDAALDAELARRFGSLPERARCGELDHWASSAESALAQVLVLDQFPRNLFRNDARAFAFDPLALVATSTAIAAGFDAQLHPLQAVFLYLPFEHAEDIAAQERAVTLFGALLHRAPRGNERLFEGYADYARRHRDVIARFGRFPHRNTLLGRVSTPAEISYLKEGGEHFGPKAR
jgi:uncharacterized protein (DUF924 family)